MLIEKKYRAECELFNKHLSENGIRKSAQRYSIMEVFLDAKHHITVAELLELVKEKHPQIGTATVYRTIKLFCEAGIAQEVDIGDGVLRYEHKYGHAHHDHLICNECGKFIEAQDEHIEKLQQQLAERHGFTPQSHRLQIFGICNECHNT
ncbi:Ferric uptake regulation protein FUR [Chitinispirillum alkaliphilum]|nr:Ferric uptake regulation protein FUR [Chitinispirillum alkaliphilum]